MNIIYAILMVHETSWNRATAGKAPPTGNPVVKSGQEPVGSGKCRKLFRKFGAPMVSNLSSKRHEGVATPTHSRPSAQADESTEGQAREDADERPSGCRLSDRLVDMTACGRSDRSSIRHSVSSFPYLEAPWEPGAELPEAGTPIPATGRRENCPLETVQMASYKKTRNNVDPIWPFLMKAAFCSSPRSDARGLPRGRRPFFTTSTNRIAYPPSAPLRSHPKENVSPCISGINPRILMASMSGPFLRPCLNICECRWSCCGMADPSTVEKRSNSLSLTVRDFMSKTSRPMPRSSTRRNTSGIRPTALLPTVPPKIWQNFTECCAAPSVKSEGHRSSFGLVSTPLSCRGPDRIFHYFCKAQYLRQYKIEMT